MLDREVASLLNEQINKELYSAYLYLDMANYYSDNGLDGFENWFYIQAQEERDHAMLFRTYLLNNDEKVTLGAIAAPDLTYEDFKAPLLAALKHEQLVTASINTIYAAAYEKRDFRTMQFLDWFVKEQGEEEKTSTDLISKFELFGQDPKSLYMLNQELGARVYSAPSLVL
ncbi:ferritin [Desulfitobacterium hafniense]|uniref:ferritin n=1 Tax=Desulfitobacterium hafniense TaxID=49338 RepID=UPI00036581D1|nr:ferritin [Desulfitobacterium hafniense]